MWESGNLMGWAELSPLFGPDGVNNFTALMQINNDQKDIKIFICKFEINLKIYNYLKLLA